MKVENEVKSDAVSIKLRRRAGATNETASAERSGASDGESVINQHSPTLHRTVGTPLRGGGTGGARARPAVRGGAPTHNAAPRAPARIDDVLDQVASLSRVESKKLLDQLLLRSKLTDKQTYNRDCDVWSQCVHNEINARLSTDESYGLMLVKKTMGESDCWAPIERFMRASKFDDRSSAERRSLYMLLAELIVDHAKHEARKYAHGLKLANVARACPDVFSIFDYSFPGYLVNGLAYVVADQRRKLAAGG